MPQVAGTRHNGLLRINDLAVVVRIGRRLSYAERVDKHIDLAGVEAGELDVDVERADFCQRFRESGAIER
ncbi:hypothetical protein D3C83_264950 [compost metagenome]